MKALLQQADWQGGIWFSRWRTFAFLLLGLSLTIEIHALNYRPRFTINPVFTSVVENAPAGTFVTRVSNYAVDDEGDSMTYSLDVGQSCCEINPTTGVVTLKAAVDRETQERIEINAYAEDNYEGGGSNRRARMIIFIYVMDVNEWPPEFKGTPYTASVYENASVGSSVLTLKATDKDQGSNADFVFEFKAGSQIPQFSLDTHTGEIEVAGQLDYETVNRYTLSVAAKDKGQPSLSSETRVIIDVIDVDDNPPIFTPSSSYETKIDENLPMDTTVIKVTADDGDKMINNSIRYEIQSGNDALLFYISPTSGDIKVNGTIDREKSSLYSLKIKAYEIPKPSSFAIADVIIQLNDVNDNTPVFENSSYIYTLDEDRPNGFIISPNLKANDQDSTIKNSAFVYSITDASGKFNVDQTSGQLTVKGKLDYEVQPNYTFQALATETLSSEKLTGHATVKIIINNVNDNSPVFSKTKYVFNVTENSPIGTLVGIIKAADADAGSFGDVFYSISTPSSASNRLSINKTSGALTIKQILDYEEAPSQSFVVVAKDGGGQNAKSTSVGVTVYINDENDNDPVFENLPQTVDVLENQPGFRIFTVKATDKDSVNNGIVSYRLLNNNFTEFQLNGFTGELNTTKPLDHEGSRNNFKLEVMAFDNGLPRRNATKILTINTKDANDHHPVFNQSSYNASILENSKIGSVVIELNAKDSDSGLNAKLTYTIVKGNEKNTFSISTSGELRTQDFIDRETQSSYELLVYASDQGSPSLSANTTVFVTIADANDNFPTFGTVSYSIKVNETAVPGTEVVALTAEDKDIGGNARISYSIVSGNDQDRFVLNTENGSLLIKQSLDWEKTTNYILNIKAEDHGSPPKSRTTFVEIEVIDNNDNTPVFTDSKYQFQIFENSPKGRSVGRVNANDRDGKIPPNRNGIVKYSITSGNTKGSFKIDENFGLISTNESLDRESSTYYNLTVTAADGGIPVRSTSIYVGVEILDVNDNPPLFANSSYEASVYENATVGTFVIEVSATDADAGTNAKITYEITSGNRGDAFIIDARGMVYVSAVIDREAVANYSLVVSAKDNGSPQMSSSVKVFIDLLDVNDNKPTFISTPYVANPSEEKGAALFVIKVTARDKDQGINSLITYSIVSSAPNSVFTINQTNGEIFTSSNLDREKHDSYILNISATDHGMEPQRSYATVLVNVADINDNTPRIGNMPNRTNVSEAARPGVEVFKVVAVDADAGINAKLSFAIVSGASSSFSIDENTGSIKVLSALDREVKDSFILAINVTDNGSPRLWASSSLEIAVTDENDNAPIFHPNPILDVAAYTVTVPEGKESVDKVIMDLNATDKDLGSNGIVRYSIFSGNKLDFFKIDSETGEVSVKNVIDRESNTVKKNSAGSGIFELIVLASDYGGIKQRSATATVTVFISDTNDNSPTFSKPFYFAGVSEGADVAARVVTVIATDQDIGQNGRVRYSIVDGNTNGDFVIANQYSGLITLAKLLNTERTPEYNLTVMATDEGAVPKNSTTKVTIKIGDLNDNDPVFNQTSYSATIKENIHSKHHVITVLATDADQGSNGEVWYQITSGNADKVFHIDNQTGDISTVLPLDRETAATKTLTIKAEDWGTPSTRKASAQVIITIEDINDNPPTLNKDVYTSHIRENSPKGTIMILSPALALDDADKVVKNPTTLTLSGQGSGNFSINSTTLAVQASEISDLDRETRALFYLTITARDNDGLTSIAYLVVVVDDVNDNWPLFKESQFNVTLREDVAVGSFVFAAHATDLDFGSNSEIAYSIRNGDGKFSINPTSGAIHLAKQLDREQKDHYFITLVASDLGQPPLESQAILHLNITDVIDYRPFFEPSVVELKVNETTPNNSVIYTVKAKDLDLNDRVIYNLSSGNNQPFHLDPITGHLKLVNRLDRENTSQYHLKIMTTDSASLSSPDNGLAITIRVLDANDNSPAFLQPFYLNDVIENTLDGTIIMTVVATDPDQGTNGKISYSIRENTAGLLGIDSATGLISKYGVWKITSGGYLNFTVVARDGGSPPREKSVPCSLRWITINSVNPRFNKSSYSISLRENTAVGSEVIRLTAYKKGVVESVTFSLTGGKGKFVIERNTGIIRIASPLDREEQDRFAMTVTAMDSQSLTGVTSVTISLLDVNDNTPVFESDTYMFSLSEDSREFSVIGVVSATDKDDGENSTISYSIISGNEHSWFSINEMNGTISTTQLIDRETQEYVTLKVMARDHGFPSLSTTAAVKITILDVNDNRPKFSKSVYNTSVNENIPGDGQVLQVNAVDGDKGQNGSISYSILSGNELGYFYIGRTTGLINIAKLLDHEQAHWFNLSIQATDNGKPRGLKSTATVRIRIIDVNDNKPRFLSQSYFFSVKENVPKGRIIGKVQAVDTDANFNAVYYRIITPSSFFSIHEINGTIMVEKPLDREAVALHVLWVEAFNKDRNGNRSLSSAVQVSIQVSDVNDNAPVIPWYCCNASVYENANIGDVVSRVAAVDADASSNKKLSYEIIQGNQEGKFKIDASTGEISVQASLDRELNNRYELIVKAMDHGTPPLSRNATIRIMILDVNDKRPEFLNTSISPVMEDSPIGMLVATISAIDKDEGQNGKVGYSIIAGNDDGSFALDSISGKLTLARLLDFETNRKHTLRITARDHGSPPWATTQTFVVTVGNVNDHTPQFAAAQLDAFVSENMPAGTSVAKVVATDADSDPIFFYIQEDKNDAFAINENSGLITTTKILDREKTSVYNFVIEATNTKRSANSVTRRKRAFTNRNQSPVSTQKVLVRVTDQNDNSPQFTQKEYRAGVSENAKYSTSVLQVIAIDVDIGINNKVVYSVIDGKSSDPFTIDSRTGWIKSAQLFAGKIGSHFEVRILAQDNDGKKPSFNDSTLAKIFVLTDNQRVVLTMGVDPQLVRDNQAEFTSVLRNITSFKINIDDIQYSKKNGVYDKTSTDLVFHAVDPVTNTIQERDVVMNALERNEVKYKNFFEKWKVQSVKPIVTSKTASKTDENTSILIGVAAGLFLLVIPFIFAICYMRRKQRRKLKAATASAKEADATLELEHIRKLHNMVNGAASGQPSSTIHGSWSLSRAPEKFVPIWIERSEDTIDSFRPLLATFHKTCSSASYFDENNSMNTIRNTKTLTRELMMLPRPYMDDIDIDNYLGSEDLEPVDDVSDLFDSLYGGESEATIDIRPTNLPPSREELLLRATLQPLATLENGGMHITSI